MSGSMNNGPPRRTSFGLPGIASAQREECRSNTKTVAFIDIITSFLELIVRGTFLYLMLTVYSQQIMNPRYATTEHLVVFYLRMILGMIGIPFILVEHGVAYFLWTAIDPTVPLKETIKRLEWWIHYNIFHVIFAFTLAMMGPFQLLNILFCFLRLYFISINYRSRIDMKIAQQADLNTIRNSYGAKPAMMTSTPNMASSLGPERMSGA